MARKRKPIFDPEVPIEAPEHGYVLASHGALNAYHRQSQAAAKHNRSMLRLTDDDSVLYGWHGIRNPLMAMLLNPKYGPVRYAMEQALNAQFVTKHPPFIDPSRPEGYTHVVDEELIPVQTGPVHETKKKVEWKTNIYS
jgi:hypothetical protein